MDKFMKSLFTEQSFMLHSCVELITVLFQVTYDGAKVFLIKEDPKRISTSTIDVWNFIWYNATFNIQQSKEKYWLNVNIKQGRTFCKFGTRNKKFPVETGRWDNVSRENGKLILCTMDVSLDVSSSVN